MSGLGRASGQITPHPVSEDVQCILQLELRLLSDSHDGVALRMRMGCAHKVILAFLCPRPQDISWMGCVCEEVKMQKRILVLITSALILACGAASAQQGPMMQQQTPQQEQLHHPGSFKAWA
jgi:hypothetical protein